MRCVTFCSDCDEGSQAKRYLHPLSLFRLGFVLLHSWQKYWCCRHQYGCGAVGNSSNKRIVPLVSAIMVPPFACRILDLLSVANFTLPYRNTNRTASVLGGHNIFSNRDTFVKAVGRTSSIFCAEVPGYSLRVIPRSSTTLVLWQSKRRLSSLICLAVSINPPTGEVFA